MASKSKKTKKGRKPVRQLILRLLVLSAVAGAILAIGIIRHGWQPFGQKTPRVSSEAKPLEKQPSEKTDEMTDKVKQVADKLKETIEEAVKAELAEIPTRQAYLLAEVKKARTSYEYRSRLNRLNRITRFGDLNILKEVASLPADETTCRLGYLYNFVQDVRDPEAHLLLEEMYRKTRDVGILRAMGRLGNPVSLAFFTKVIEEGKVPKPLYAFYGMRELYLVLEERGDQKACVAVRECIYNYVDRDLMTLVRSDPLLISVIPHPGSLDRLHRVHEHYAKLGSNVAYEIGLHIRRCKEKISRLEKDNNVAQPVAPADADKPRR
mgnify:CR=1 FL=1